LSIGLYSIVFYIFAAFNLIAYFLLWVKVKTNAIINDKIKRNNITN